ncbi:organ-specific protein S2 [Malania oleifera]|uniref:organ-specific protein S2 n=1 Tax=Malania oleifera TaxID=397392 RepID=UPI0025AEC88C|nr:organ-specific protein S2 [Malania oleifera]
MKSITAFFILFSLTLLFNAMDARKGPGDYWKSIMKDQPMPEAIKGFFLHDPAASNDEHNFLTKKAKSSQFSKHFDPRPNAILYHSHVKQPEDEQFSVESLNPKPRHDDQQKI